MSNFLLRRAPVAALLSSIALAGGWISHRNAAAQVAALDAPKAASRPQYRIEAQVDYDLLTLSSSATVKIPVARGDSMRDAVFFLYANAGGVGGDDARRKNLVVDWVHFDSRSTALPFKFDGAVLRVDLGAAQVSDFTLVIKYHGVVPRGAKEEGGLGGMMGGALGSDISSMLGIGDKTANAPVKPKNTDYGLYTYGNGILSLGSFWYPALAVRRAGKWADDAPEGLGDVAFAEKSDFDVEIQAPQSLTLVAPGEISQVPNGNGTTFRVRANDVREFAVLLSEDFVQKSGNFAVGGKNVVVSAILLKKNAAKLDSTLDIAGKSLQIFSKRFGNYPFGDFKIVEAPMKGGAGGMEYSRVIGIASSLYGDMGAQLGDLTSSLQIPGADKLLESLGDDTLSAGGAAPQDDEGGDGGNAMTAMLGGVLGQQKQLFDSILETTIAHEVAHQWWAIGVGSDSQKHPFVDESLTNWSAMLYFEDRYGAVKAAQMRDLHLKTSFSMGAMLGGGDKRADLPTAAYTNNLQYGAVIYGKGALFYDEMRKVLGDAAFFGALRNYFAAWNNKIADEKTLRQLFIAAAPAKRGEIEALYKHWIEEAHGSEDIGGGAMNLDLGGMLGGLLGGNMGEIE